mgnify:FL=1
MNGLDSTTEPTAAQVSEFLDNSGATLEQRLRKIGYTVPATDVDLLDFLKETTVYAVGSRVANIIREFELARDLYKKYQDNLKMLDEKIIGGTQAFVGAGSHKLPRSWSQENETADGVDAVITREFKL